MTPTVLSPRAAVRTSVPLAAQVFTSTGLADGRPPLVRPHSDPEAPVTTTVDQAA